jgi:hypothetical protein
MVGKRGLWLDDLFVIPAYRGKGIGRAFMAYLADIALRHQCGRLEWMVLDWNEPAIGFYKRLGATILTDWRVCRLEEAQLSGVAGKSPAARGRRARGSDGRKPAAGTVAPPNQGLSICLCLAHPVQADLCPAAAAFSPRRSIITFQVTSLNRPLINGRDSRARS